MLEGFSNFHRYVWGVVYELFCRLDTFKNVEKYDVKTSAWNSMSSNIRLSKVEKIPRMFTEDQVNGPIMTMTQYSALKKGRSWVLDSGVMNRNLVLDEPGILLSVQY